MQNQKHTGNLIPIHSTHFNRINYSPSIIRTETVHVVRINGYSSRICNKERSTDVLVPERIGLMYHYRTPDYAG